MEYPSNALTSEHLNKHIHSFEPCVIRGDSNGSPMVDVTNEEFTRCNEVVDVSCLPSNSDCEFKGSISDRKLLLLELKEYCEAFIARRKMNDLKLYLSQLCLYSSDANENSSPLSSAMRRIYATIQHRTVPFIDFIMNSYEVDQTNLWMNIDASTSALHYDGFHNILYVDQGSKHITLISPKYTEILYPGSSHSLSTANHSSVASSSISSLSEISLTSILQPGDAVFIPEGWWHRVRSQEFTVALNYWFRSPVHSILHDRPHMMPYILRSLVLELTAQEVDKRQYQSTEQIKQRREKGELVPIYSSIEQLRSHIQRLHQTITIVEQGAAPSSIQSEQWNSLIRIKTDLELEFLTCTLSEMKHSWLLLTDMEYLGEDELNGKMIHRIILSLEPISAYRLLRLWDSTETKWTPDETRTFFDALLQLKAKDIQDYIVDQSDVYRKQVGQDFLTRLNIME